MTSKWLLKFLTAQAPLAGVLRDHVGTFATALEMRGYARSTTKEAVRLVAHFGRWLGGRGLSVSELDETQALRFLAHRKRLGRKPRCNVARLQILLAVMRDVGAIPGPIAPDVSLKVTPIVEVESAFARYLVQERGLSAASCTNYVPVVRRLLRRRFGSGPVKLAEIGAEDITRFIASQARTASPGRMKVVVPALRAFLRWLFLQGETCTNLTGCVPRVADWRLTTLPKSIEREQVEHLLHCCVLKSAIGRRDYAILLLLARLGLRAGEVVAMELDDIDWEVGQLLVRGKGGRHDRLPLPRDVGAALAAYLRHGRPSCSTRRVFVRAKAPRRGFGNSVAICDVVRRALARAGLEPSRKGAHLLRHALACTMLRSGSSLREIGEVLRHRSADTTALYAKVDVAALRAVVQPWPLSAGDA